jgi:ABC-2 type transport system permease protein
MTAIGRVDHPDVDDIAPTVPRRRVFGVDPDVVLAIAARDLTAVRRSKSIMLPMILVPTILLAVLPLVLGFVAAKASSAGIERFLDNVPERLAESIGRLPEREQLVVLVNGYLLAPLFLIVPLMVSAVLAADAFAGEKERRTIESLLHLPATDREVYVAKMLTAFGPAVAVSWVGFVVFAVVSNAVAWPVMHRVFVPTALWLVMIFWVAPAVAALGLGIMVRVSARTRTTQEANQLGGTVILPLIVLTLGQATGLLLVDLSVALAVGAVTWIVALVLNLRGAKRFSRDHMATQV